MKNYEDQAERRLRKVNDIKAMFWKRCSEEEKKDPKERMIIMEIYDEVGYCFYLSADEIRHIIAGRR